MEKGKEYEINYWNSVWSHLKGKFIGETVDGDSLFENEEGIHVIGDFRIVSSDRFTVKELINILNTFNENSTVELSLDDGTGTALETRGSNLTVINDGDMVRIGGKCYTIEY